MDQLGDYLYSKGGWWFGGAEVGGFYLCIVGKMVLEDVD